jgi:phosphoribosylformylglycinamidine synthase subunit PurL
VIGRPSPTRALPDLEGETLVGDMPVAPLNEAPTYTREGREDPAVRARASETSATWRFPTSPRATLLSTARDPTIASKRPVYRSTTTR